MRSLRLIFSNEAPDISGASLFLKHFCCLYVLIEKEYSMSKKLCKADKIKKKHTLNPYFECKKCGLQSNKESKLCKPNKI